jgi:hypothetical protein
MARGACVSSGQNIKDHAASQDTELKRTGSAQAPSRRWNLRHVDCRNHQTGVRKPAYREAEDFFTGVEIIEMRREYSFMIISYRMWGGKTSHYDFLSVQSMRLDIIRPPSNAMPRIITTRHRESETERARNYIKSRLMLPTIPLAMVALLTGYGGMAVLWFDGKLTAQALGSSTALFLFGVILGWAHARYERYLIRVSPEYFARKHKLLEAAKEYKRPKRDLPSGGPNHPGRAWVPIIYAVAISSVLGLSVFLADQLGVYAAFFLPWAGYFNAKVISWRTLFAP